MKMPDLTKFVGSVKNRDEIRKKSVILTEYLWGKPGDSGGALPLQEDGPGFLYREWFLRPGQCRVERSPQGCFPRFHERWD